MHPGIAEADLGKLILEQNARKWDLVVPSTALLTFDAKLVPSADENQPATVRPTVNFAHNGHGQIEADLTGHAFKQLASWAEIPAKYVDRMKTPAHAALLNQNVQHWLDDTAGKRMLRLFKAQDGGLALLRAFFAANTLRRAGYETPFKP